MVDHIIVIYPTFWGYGPHPSPIDKFEISLIEQNFPGHYNSLP